MRSKEKPPLTGWTSGAGEAKDQRSRRVVGLSHDCIMSGIYKQGEGLKNGAKTG